MTSLRDYYGWRARIGLIYMDSGTAMEAEFYAMAPEGVSTHTSRIHLPEVTVSGLSAMMSGDAVEVCTRQLAAAPLHAILFGGTSATFLEGIGWDEKIAGRMASIAGGVPVTTTSTALLRALRALEARRIAFVTPYIEEVTERGRRFLEANGFEVLSSDGLGLSRDHDIGNVKTEEIYGFARRVAHPEAEALAISCTNLRTIGAIAPLEEDLGVPVVSANQASFWDCLRLAKVGAPVRGFGRLFELRGEQAEAARALRETG